MKLRVLDLFSGIGGFSLGLERTGRFETVAFCEENLFCQKVIEKHWKGIPIFPDVRELKGEDVGPVDVICGGYPCQPFSVAGRRQGQADDRHLWPEMYRLVDALRPAWVIGENVAGHISMGLDDVLSDLEASGYTARTFVIPACAVDAPHRRDRCWIVAHSECINGERRGSERRGPASTGSCATVDGSSEHAITMAHTSEPGPHVGAQRRIHSGEKGAGPRDAQFQRRGEALADANQPGPQGRDGKELRECADEWSSWAGNSQPHDSQWLPEPDVGRVAHGVPNRVDRLKALGNAVVPQVVEMIGNAILEAERAAAPGEENTAAQYADGANHQHHYSRS